MPSVRIIVLFLLKFSAIYPAPAPSSDFEKKSFDQIMTHLLNKHADVDMEIATREDVDIAPDEIEDTVKNKDWNSRVAPDYNRWMLNNINPGRF